MRKIIFSFCTLLTLVSLAFGQQGQAVLKIVVDEEGKIAVYDMQGNPVTKREADSRQAQGHAVLDEALDSDTPEAIAYRQSLIERGLLLQGGAVATSAENQESKERAKLEGGLILLDLLTSEDAAASALRQSLQQRAILRGGGTVTKSPQSGSELLTGPAVSARVIPDTVTEGSASLDAIQSGENTGRDQFPNLTLTDGSFAYDPSLCQLTMRATVINDGGQDAGAMSILGYYLSADDNIERTDTRLDTSQVPPLGQNETHEAIKAIDISDQTGTFYLGWIVDVREAIFEGNEADNEFIGAIDGAPVTLLVQCDDSLPNLTFNFENTNWSYDTESRQLNLATRITNTGGAVATGSRLVYLLSEDTLITNEDCLLGDDEVEELAPGQHSDESFQADLCQSSCDQGEWYIGWLCDADSVIAESKEDDNVAISGGGDFDIVQKVTIPVSCPLPAPNLTLDPARTLWEFDPNSCVLRMETLVVNIGTAGAGESRLGYYLSEDANITTSDSRIGDDSVNQLAPGEDDDEDFSANLRTVDGTPDFDRHGEFYIGWIADYLDQVDESNENDNTAASERTIQCPEPRIPNLTLDPDRSAWTFDPNMCILSLRSRVRNIGNGAAGESFLGYYLSENTVIELSDSRIGEDSVQELAPGDFSDETFTADLNEVTGTPPFDPFDEFFIGWIVDYTDEVAESNEGDNRFRSDGAIQCPAPDGPNLTFDFNRTEWEFDAQSRILKLKARVINNGDLPAPPSKLGYFLSENPTISATDCPIGDDGVALLPPGGHDDETFSRVLCNASCGEGMWYIGWICDLNNEVEESDEDDNTAVSSSGGDTQGEPTTIAFDCTDPNLTLVTDRTDWSFDAKDCFLRIESRVINNGNERAGVSHLGYYLSNDAQITTSDSRIGDDRVDELDPGEFNDEGFSANLDEIEGDPEFDPNDVFFLGWIVDFRDQVFESNEDDNRFHSENTLTCGLPNLVIDADDSEATFEEQTCMLRIDTRVRNVGNATAGESRLGYYLSENTNITTSDSRIGDDRVRVLAPGEADGENIDVDLSEVAGTPPFDAGKTQFIGLICDYLDEVVELDDGDNTAFFEPAIEVDCPVDIASIRPVAPLTVRCGDMFFLAILVGSPNPVSDLFGLSFDVTFPTGHLDYLSAQVTDPDNNRPNLLGEDLLFLDTADEANGRVSIGVSRKGGEGVSGSGPVAWLKFMVAEETPEAFDAIWSLADITANDADGRPIILEPRADSTEVTCEDLCVVWPGDTNNDGIVSAADVLPVGVHFDRTGPSRPNASSVWTGQQVACWTPESATYADANGNGEVGSEDVLPVGINFGKTHEQPLAKALPAEMASRAGSNGAEQTALQSSETVVKPVLSAIAGDTIVVDVRVADAAGLFGIAFDLVYQTDSEAVKALDAKADPFFGSDLLFLPQIMLEQQTVSIGMARKAPQPGVNGDGALVRVVFSGFETAPVGTQVTFELREVQAVDSEGAELAVTVEGSDPVVTSVDERRTETTAVPETFGLAQNYPNPFNPETTIEYRVPEVGRVVLKVYDLLGNEVRTLVDEVRQAGVHRINWNGRDNAGRTLATGVYIYKLHAGSFTAVRKMVYMK